MKLLYTITAYPPSVGGAQIHSHLLLQYLAPDLDVQVATLWDRHRTDWLLGTTLRAERRPRDYTLDGIDVRVLGLNRLSKFAIAPAVAGYIPFRRWAVERLARPWLRQLEPLAERVDVVHNNRIGREPLTAASLGLARRLDVPFVFTPNHHPRWTGWMHRTYLEIYRQADLIIGFTEADRETMARLGVDPDRVAVTGIGPVVAEAAEPARFREEHDLGDAPIVLFLGQKYAYKGIDLLLDAAGPVLKRVPDARFVFLGPRTRYSVRRFGEVADRRIVELPPVDLQEKSDALAAAQVVAVPSSQESFGGVLVEGFHYGKPVIGRNIPATRHVVDHGADGFLVEGVDDLIDRLCLLLTDASLRDTLGRRGQAKQRDRYTWPAIARKTRAAYSRALGNPTEPRQTTPSSTARD